MKKILVNAVQEQQVLIDKLIERIKALESKLEQVIK